MNPQSEITRALLFSSRVFLENSGMISDWSRYFRLYQDFISKILISIGCFVKTVGKVVISTIFPFNGAPKTKAPLESPERICLDLCQKAELSEMLAKSQGVSNSHLENPVVTFEMETRKVARSECAIADGSLI
jgi:hypothetical protein